MDVYDIVVIGAGPGGYPAAIRAAQLGAKVAIVEREYFGGTCLNWGCIPTKVFAGVASLVHQVRHKCNTGIRVQGIEVDYPALFQHKERVVHQLRNGVKQLLQAHGVNIVTGNGRFVDPHTIEVQSEGQRTCLTAKRVIIASGSTSLIPPQIPQHERIVDSRGFLALQQLPASLLVIGGGYIGCELACIAAVAGVRVTIVEMLDDVLTILDPDVRREVRSFMENILGIKIITGTKIEELDVPGTEVRVKTGNGEIVTDMVLVATGRKPVTDGLDIEKAGVKTDGRGFVIVDDYGRTNVGNIYAVGDVTGRMQLAHYATSQGLTVAENACKLTLQRFETVVPSVIFTIPEAASVGLTETMAKAEGRDVQIAKFRFGGLGRAVAAAETMGFVKLITDPGTDQLLGAAVVGPHATELIAELTVAVRAEITAKELASTIHAHPTFSEAWMEAAHAVHGLCVHAPPKKR